MNETSVVFDESNADWSRDPISNELFLKAIQSHSNNLLRTQGHIFLNDVLRMMSFPRTRFGQTHGWLSSSIRDIEFTKVPLTKGAIRIEFNVLDQDILDQLP